MSIGSDISGKAFVVATLIAALSGCTNLSGLGGQSWFSCKAPVGVSCKSVSGVYANSVANNLPDTSAQPLKPKPEDGDRDSAKDKDKSSKVERPVYPTSPAWYMAAPNNGDPVLSPPRVLRIWLAPWKDQDGDLRDQSYIYVMWDRGEWNIQHTRDKLMNAYAPVTLAAPPVSVAPSPVAAEAPASQQDTPPLQQEAHDAASVAPPKAETEIGDGN